MRRLVPLLMMSAVFPAIGDTPAQVQSQPRSNVQFSLDVLPPSTAFQLFPAAPKISRPLGVVVRAPSRPCYYIRQLNKNLQKPKNKPELVPLADNRPEPAAAPIAGGNPDCFDDSILRVPGDR